MRWPTLSRTLIWRPLRWVIMLAPLGRLLFWLGG